MIAVITLFDEIPLDLLLKNIVFIKSYIIYINNMYNHI